MPKRKGGFNEEPIRYPGEELEAIRAKYEQEFAPSSLGPEEWAGSLFRLHCEMRLYVFCKYVLGMGDMVERLHGKVADWLQDMNPRGEHQITARLSVMGGRWKLLMLPVVHLKTSLASHGFPLHALIQPAGGLYFPELAGADTRILLHGETQDKAMENLSFIRQHLEFNRVLRWLWPEIMWESRKDAQLWTDSALTVRRSGRKILAEPSITAIGVGTGLEQRHYNLVIMDDLATFDAAQSEVIMERARQRRKACRSRLNDLVTGIEIGVGTHWTPTDIYTDWRRDPDVEVCIRAAIEDGEPIWPERHPLDKLLALQAEEGMGKILFSANYMNNPLNSIFTALDWQEVRRFEFDELAGTISWEQSEIDLKLLDRNNMASIENANLYALYGRPVRGMTLDQFYSGFRDDEPEDAKARAERMRARQERYMSDLEEGCQEWVRLSVLWERKRREYEQG
jgi:hypothetical protein